MNKTDVRLKMRPKIKKAKSTSGAVEKFTPAKSMVEKILEGTEKAYEPGTSIFMMHGTKIKFTEYTKIKFDRVIVVIDKFGTEINTKVGKTYIFEPKDMLDFRAESGVMTFDDKEARLIQFEKDTEVLIIKKSFIKKIGSGQVIKYTAESILQIERQTKIRFAIKTYILFQDSVKYLKEANEESGMFDYTIDMWDSQNLEGDTTNANKSTGTLVFGAGDTMAFYSSIRFAFQKPAVIVY